MTKTRKPIINPKGEEDNFVYKYCRKAYAADIEVEFMTDLSDDQFEKLFEGGYSKEQVERFETDGSFEEVDEK